LVCYSLMFFKFCSFMEVDETPPESSLSPSSPSSKSSTANIFVESLDIIQKYQETENVRWKFRKL